MGGSITPCSCKIKKFWKNVKKYTILRIKCKIENKEPSEEKISIYIIKNMKFNKKMLKNVEKYGKMLLEI